VDQRLVERVRTLGDGRGVLIREVYVPSASAWVLGNLKVAVGFAFTGAVVGVAFVLLLFAAAEQLVRRVLRWRYA
jgi:NitT/TauT family transport system permease protein